ncbi:Importin-9 [Dactylellina cionopaga]|nr:Importin-9 [Dactylellina cionopaga]
MEQKVHYLLTALQSSEEGPRRTAEAELFQLYSEDSFPLALIHIAAATDLDFTGRQAAIVYIRSFIDECWSPPYDKYAGPPIKDEVKHQIRNSLLQLLSDKERKIRAAAAFAVSRIASHDFPEEWPSLLQDLLSAIPTATDEQLHGLLKVLTDLVEDGFSEDQFFPVAHQLVEVLYHVATSENRPSNIRSLAVQAVRSCIELLEMVKDGHPEPVAQFATKVVDVWMSFFIQVLEKPLLQLIETNVEEYNGLVTLKLQTYKTISKIVSVFPGTMTKYMTSLFKATWAELSSSKERYVKDFVEGDADGRLTNVDGLPFTLDLLVLEEADFLQVCLRAKSVKEEFLQAINASTQPLEQLVYTCVLLAQITGEDEGLWELDYNVFVAEETAMTANYTARTAASDLVLVS